MPRVFRVNYSQIGTTNQVVASGMRAVTGFRMAIKNDPVDPLTVGMFCRPYAPE